MSKNQRLAIIIKHLNQLPTKERPFLTYAHKRSMIFEFTTAQQATSFYSKVNARRSFPLGKISSIEGCSNNTAFEFEMKCE